MSLKKVFFRDSFLYGVTSYLGVVAGIILTPIYTRYFTKVEYGIMDLINTWNNFMLIVVPLGLTTGVIRLYHEYSGDPKMTQKFLGSVLMVLMGLIAIYVGLAYFGHDLLVGLYYGPETDRDLVLLSYGIVGLSVLKSYLLAIHRVRFEIKKYLLINIIPFFVLVILGYYLAVTLEFRIKGFFYAGLAASFIGVLIGLAVGRKNFTFHFQWDIVRSALRYSAPLLVVLVFFRFTHLIDRALITNFMTTIDLGDYSIAMRINTIYNFAVNAFAAAWIPLAMAKLKEEGREHLYSNAFNYYLLGFGFIAAAVIIGCRELLLFFAPAYLNTEPLIYILIITTYINGLCHFMGLGIHAHKRSGFFILSATIALVVNVGVSYALIKPMGLYGIAVGSLVAVVVWTLTEYSISAKLSNIRYKLQFIAYGVAGLGFASAAGWWLSTQLQHPAAAIGIKMVLLAAVGYVIDKKTQLSKPLRAYLKKMRSKN